MAQPRAYTQTNTFNDWTTTNPSDPHIGSKFDTEFTELKQNTDDLNLNIALIQRDDGKIKNEAIHKDAFDQDALALIGASGSGFTPKGDWTNLKSTVAISTWASDGASPAKSIITKTGHGLADNTLVRLSTSATLPTGFVANTDYYVVSATADTFKLSATSGGAAIAYTNAGSGTHSYSFPNTYVSGDIVNNNDATYLTVAAHTSGPTFAGDQPTHWTLIANSAISTTGASVNTHTSTSGQTVFTTTYTYSTPEDIQVYQNGVLTATTLYSISNSGGNNITLNTAPATGTIVIIWGDAVVNQQAKAATLGYRDTANNHKTTASRWAYLQNATVIDAETSGNSNEYSAKEYAIGTTVATGSAKDWAQLATTPSAIATEASAREWAVGVSTHKGDASAKEYATSAQYDSVEGSSEYSAKHYSAQAQDWAVKATIVRNDANGADVDYSSKEWATGQLAANTSGSAKQWALGGGDFVEGTAVEGSDYSAKKYASNSSAYATASADSATASANSAAAISQQYDGFNDKYLGTMSDLGATSSASTTGTWLSGSSTVTVASATGISVGQLFASAGGAGVPTGANVLSISGTSIVISDTFTAAQSGATAVTFNGYGVYGNFNSTKDGPDKDNDNNTLVTGTLYFNTSDNTMKIYDGGNWIAATSAGTASLLEYKFITTSAQVSSKTYSGTADIGGSMSYTAANTLVYLNGVLLKETVPSGATHDYVAQNGTSIVLTNAASLNDELTVVAFKSFTVADTVSSSSGGTFAGAVTFSAGLTGNVAGNASGTAATVTTAAQPAITSVGTLTALTVTGAITANGGLETDTNSKVVQKGAFMQSSTHQALTLGV